MASPKHKPLMHQFVEHVLQPHADLANMLLRRRPKRWRRSFQRVDAWDGFEIMAATAFLAGIDKALSLALVWLYLSGKVDFRWLTNKKKGDEKDPPNLIRCDQGFAAKLRKLQELGFDITEAKLARIARMRNSFIHSCSLCVGYGVGISHGDEKPKLELRATGPDVYYSGPPQFGLSEQWITTTSRILAKHLGTFLNKQGCGHTWSRIQAKLQKLPVNPEPYYSQLQNPNAGGDKLDALDKLNEQTLGERLCRLLPNA